MRRSSPYRPVYLATILALMSSLLITFNAVADDPIPTLPTLEETSLPPIEETAPPPPTEQTITIPSEEPPVAENSDLSVAELLSEIPDNTSIVLTVDNEIVPLVTTEATEVILVGDPVWCPAGVLPTPSNNGCTASYPDLASLLDDIDNSVILEPSADGTIWIMAGNDASAIDLDIDGSIFTTWGNYSLTLQGGWDGNASGNISGTSTFSVPITISNWQNTVTLNQIIINSTSSTGLDVSTAGDINLQDVSSSNNVGAGAELSATGNITLTGNNTFDNNGDTGLYAEADGNISLENTTADGNDGYGVELYSLNDVIFNGDNDFSDNLFSGAYVEADGNVQGGSISANNNGEYGAEIYSSNNVILTGTNTLDNNVNSGLYVEAGNSIDANNLTTNNNGGAGTELYASGSINLQGSNNFNGNVDSGVYIESDGSIVLANITASGNGENGASLYTTDTITVDGVNIFVNNAYSGLYIESDGNTLLANITANGNGTSGIFGSGIELYTLASTTISGTNVFIGNLSDGVTIDSNGDISISNVISSNNGASGLSLETNGDAVVTCGVLSDNAGYEIEADTGGYLILNGVDFGNDLDNEIGADDEYLILNSNSCYTYPNFSNSEDENSPASSGVVLPPPTLPDLPIHTLAVESGQSIELNCETYKGTLITLPDGDGAYIPCPIIDSAELFELGENNLPLALPTDVKYLDSFLLAIFEGGKPFGPLDIPGSVWYATPEQIQNSGVQVFFYNGMEWVEISDRITPFMDIFFDISDLSENSDLAIMYWDGTKWIEIAEPEYLGDGYIIQTGGHKSDDGLYFMATLNFTGTFVLVQK